MCLFVIVLNYRGAMCWIPVCDHPHRWSGNFFFFFAGDPDHCDRTGDDGVWRVSPGGCDHIRPGVHCLCCGRSEEGFEWSDRAHCDRVCGRGERPSCWSIHGQFHEPGPIVRIGHDKWWFQESRGVLGGALDRRSPRRPCLSERSVSFFSFWFVPRCGGWLGNLDD